MGWLVAFGMPGRRGSLEIPAVLAGSATVSAFHEPVSLADPDPDWPRQYVAEAVLIERELAAFDPVIEHIGSTAVPLRAKPIIDIQVAVREPDVPAAVDALRTLA